MVRHVRGQPRLFNLPLAEIRNHWFRAGSDVPPPRVRAALEADGRAGAAILLARAESLRRQRRREQRHYRRLLRHERALWNRGIKRVAGVDEAGMGCLAGPVVAAAVILAPETRLPGLDDSKVLNRAQRQAFHARILETAVAWGVGRAEATEVDELNVYQAGLVAMQRAVAALPRRPQHLLVDARRVPGFPGPQEALVHGDALSASIAAASVVAKVTRDRIMEQYDELYPGYGFARHKGYGTAAHRRALARLAPSPIHRKSFQVRPLEAS